MIKNNIPKAGLLVLTMLGSTSVLADDLNYNYVQAAYLDTEIDSGAFDVDGDGLAVSGSVELGESMFLTAGYAAQEFDFGVDLDQWAIGVGGHLPISETIDLVGSVSYVDAEVDTRFGDADDDGYGASIGIRARVADNVELEGGINYVDLDTAGDETSFGFGGRYYFTEAFALGAGVELGDDVTGWNVGVRYEF